jgi:hypothetical protein
VCSRVVNRFLVTLPLIQENCFSPHLTFFLSPISFQRAKRAHNRSQLLCTGSELPNVKLFSNFSYSIAQGSVCQLKQVRIECNCHWQPCCSALQISLLSFQADVGVVLGRHAYQPTNQPTNHTLA